MLSHPEPGSHSPHGLPLIGVLIVTWNRRTDVLDCISSVLRSDYPSLAVYVVDNASADGSSEAVAAEFPDVRLIRSERNLGFAGGNNLGLTAMLNEGIEGVFLLNDDAMTATDTISSLVEGFGDPSLGVLAPKVLVHGQDNVIWSAGGTVDPDTGVTVQRCYGRRDGGQADKACEVDYAVGCAMLVKSDVIRKVGKLDPRYFMYYEETEWCRRIRSAGYRIVYVPHSRVWHKVKLEETGRNNSPYYFSRNRLLYLSSGDIPGNTWAAAADILRSAAAHAVRGRTYESRLMIKAVVDYYSGRFGRIGGRL